jgi:O-antigen ligase
MGLLRLSQSVVAGYVLSTLGFVTLAGTLLLLSNDASLPLVLILGGAGAAACFIMLRYPLEVLYLAVFLRLLPIDFRIDPYYTAALSTAIALALVAWWADPGRRTVHWNEVLTLMAVYVMWAGISISWAENFSFAFEKLISLAIRFSLVFLVVNQIRSLASVDGFMNVLRLMGWIFIIAGWQATLSEQYKFGDRLQVLGMNENWFAISLILVLPSMIWPVLRSSGPRRTLRFVMSIAFLLSTVALVLLSGSRTGSVSMAITMLTFGLWKPLRPWAVSAIIIGLAIMMAAPILLETLLTRLEERELASEGGRLILWQASWHAIREHPITGVGIGNGAVELVRYLAVLTNDYNYRDSLTSHNPLLEVGVDTGLFGMVVYSSIFTVALVRFIYCWQQVRDDELIKGLFRVIFVSVVGYLAWFANSGDIDPSIFLVLSFLVIPTQVLRSEDGARQPQVGPMVINANGDPARFARRVRSE